MHNRVEPHRVTKPIQLLAAWLLGLIVVDGSFLSAAAMITRPAWASGLLVCAAVLNVPLFLFCIFVLQTRFRPEMQEDAFYARYLEIREATRTPFDPAIELQSIRQTFSESTRRTVSVVEQVRTQLASVVKQIAEFRTVTEGRQLVDPGPLTRALEEAKAELENARIQNLWSVCQISLNDLLPRYSAIRAALALQRIPIVDTFGSNSEDPRPPQHVVIAIGSDIPIIALRKILETVAPFGIEYLNHAAEPWDAGRIYIGAYGYQGEPLLPVTPALMTRLQEVTNDTQLAALFEAAEAIVPKTQAGDTNGL